MDEPVAQYIRGAPTASPPGESGCGMWIVGREPGYLPRPMSDASEASSSAAGQEVLVVDGDEQVLKGLDRLLTRVGLVVTGTTDPVRARDQLLNKFYAVALIDADTPTPGGGIELLQFTRDKSPLTSVIVMTARKSYEISVKAFRSGASDCVLKEPDVVPYLRERVLEAASELQSTGERNTLMEEISETHEEFLRRMRDLVKEVVDLEDRASGRGGTNEDDTDTMSVVLVDDDPSALAKIEAVLTAANGWHFQVAVTGGEALDIVTQTRPQIVLVKEQLPDLPGSMVVKTVRAGAPDAVTLLYNPPPRPGVVGDVRMVDASRTITLVPNYTDAEQLAAPLGEIREGLRQKTKERRYLQAFRQRNYEFLQRYASLKGRIKAALEKGKK
jgi:DNA-binding response OmpR family regulator